MSLMKRNKISDRYFTSLSCKIFIMGCATEGESAVIILYDGTDVVYSCVVDSFVCDDKIVAKELLCNLKISHITDLFWTHPHDDHSRGMISLIDEFSPETIYLASELHDLSDNIKTHSVDVLQRINMCRGYDGRCVNESKVKGISTNSLIKSEELRVGTKVVPFRMYTIAPVNGRLREKVIKASPDSALNDFSLAFSVDIGDFSILLTGDVQDRMINTAREELCGQIYTPNLLKIPHHGSNYSTEILSIFDGDDLIDYGITTSKRSSGLPTDEALSIYHSKCSHTYKIDSESKKCAVWGIDVDIVAGKVTNIMSDSFVEYV